MPCCSSQGNKKASPTDCREGGQPGGGLVRCEWRDGLASPGCALNHCAVSHMLAPAPPSLCAVLKFNAESLTRPQNTPSHRIPKNVLHTKNEGVESCRKLRQCYMSTLTTLFYASRLSPPPPTRNPALKPRTAAGKSLQSKCCRTRQRLRQHPSVWSTAPPLPRRGAEGCRIFRGGERLLSTLIGAAVETLSRGRKSPRCGTGW